MSDIPTMASEAPLHSCPSCPAVTDRDDLCVNCGDPTEHDHQGVCDICDPAPLLASLADSRVSPEVVRLAVEAAVKAARDEWERDLASANQRATTAICEAVAAGIAAEREEIAAWLDDCEYDGLSAKVRRRARLRIG